MSFKCFTWKIKPIVMALKLVYFPNWCRRALMPDWEILHISLWLMSLLKGQKQSSHKVPPRILQTSLVKKQKQKNRLIWGCRLKTVTSSVQRYGFWRKEWIHKISSLQTSRGTLFVLNIAGHKIVMKPKQNFLLMCINEAGFQFG